MFYHTAMTPLRFVWVDAFTDKQLAGNPCAVVLDADGLSPARMQALAREFNLSETAFVLRSKKADVRARYFTPAGEIPLAGHPTLATMRALVDCGRIRAPRRVALELKAGIVSVEVGARTIAMRQLEPRFLRRYSAAEALPAFGLSARDLLAGAPIQTVSTGTPQLMVPVKSLAALRRARLDPARYARLRARADFFSPHLFCITGKNATFARHLGAPPESAEDPFTGSATGGMGAYLWRRGLIRTPRFTAAQSDWLGRPGRAFVEVHGPREAIEAVTVGGAATIVARGTLAL